MCRVPSFWLTENTGPATAERRAPGSWSFSGTVMTSGCMRAPTSRGWLSRMAMYTISGSSSQLAPPSAAGEMQCMMTPRTALSVVL